MILKQILLLLGATVALTSTAMRDSSDTVPSATCKQTDPGKDTVYEFTGKLMETVRTSASCKILPLQSFRNLRCYRQIIPITKTNLY